MPSLDRTQRRDVLHRATQMHEHVTAWMRSREEAMRGARAAYDDLARRWSTLPRQVTPGGGARCLVVSPHEDDLLAGFARAESFRAIPDQVTAQLTALQEHLPSALADAREVGFFGRLFGSAPATPARDRALDYLLGALHRVAEPDLAAALRLTDPAAPRAAAPRDEAALRSLLSRATGVAPDRLLILPGPLRQSWATSFHGLARLPRSEREAVQTVGAAAEAAVAASADHLLEEIDLDLFRGRVETVRFPMTSLRRAGVNTVAALLALGPEGIAAIDGISGPTASALVSEARAMRETARTQADIDLTAADEPALVHLLEQSKAVLELRWISAGADEDIAVVTALPGPLRDPDPNGASGGPAPCVLLGERPQAARDAAGALEALHHRALRRVKGQHLSEEQRQRQGASAVEDYREHPEDYRALLTELGFGDRISTGTHGDLSAELIQKITSTALDTSQLTLPSLRRYQEFAARFAIRQQRVIIGDEMGLGKTVEALAVAGHMHATGMRHVLVVCPAAVLTNWIREIESKTRLRAHRLHGTGRDDAVLEWADAGGVGVTTFDTLARLQLAASGITPRTVIIDEAHSIKNPSIRRTRAAREHIDRAECVVLMTGTPLENRWEEFRTLIGYLQPELARTAEGLLPPAFRQHIAPTYLRRNQEDVLKELPELTEVQEWIEFSDADRAAYERAVQDGSFHRMRQAAMLTGSESSKRQRLREILQEAVENGRKVLVFSFYRSVLAAAASEASGAVFGPIDGSVAPSLRQEIVDEFSAHVGGAVLVAQIQAGGQGLNIQAASVVVICEPQVKPSLEVQAIARAHRMGQSRSVQVHRLLSDEGIDPAMVEILSAKSTIFDEYARESATKSSHDAATATTEISLERAVMSRERDRLGLTEPPAEAPRTEEPDGTELEEDPADQTATAPSSAALTPPVARAGDLPGYAVIDVETTGFSPSRHHRIVEIAVLLVSPTGEIQGEWSTLVNPHRDIPNAEIHGITATDIVRAPSFADIAPRLLADLRGRTIAAHNAPFDLRFLLSELERAGLAAGPLPPPAFCTMTWSTTFVDAASRRLSDCCAAAGVVLEDAHSAGADAHATAELLGHYLSLLDGSEIPWQQTLEDAYVYPWPTSPPGEAALLARHEARTVRSDDWLDRIVARMPATASATTDSYLAVLETALLDDVLAEHEKDELVALASDLGLGRKQVEDLHRQYLGALAQIAWEDGVVTPAERERLARVADLLGLEPREITSALERAAEPTSEDDPRTALARAGITLRPGDRVVFTGSLRRPRADWEEAAAQAGLVPGGVTRTTRLVVAADPNSQSGKAAKARVYGIPIITEQAFTALLEQVETAA